MPNDHDSPNSHRSHPTAEEIARCAFLIWKEEGCPTGREREHWSQAESQLLACRAHDSWIGHEDTKADHEFAE